MAHIRSNVDSLRSGQSLASNASLSQNWAARHGATHNRMGAYQHNHERLAYAHTYVAGQDTPSHRMGACQRNQESVSHAHTYVAVQDTPSHRIGHRQHSQERVDFAHTYVAGQDSPSHIRSRPAPQQPGRYTPDFRNHTFDASVTGGTSRSLPKQKVMSPVTAALMLAHQGNSSPEHSAYMLTQLQELEACAKQCQPAGALASF